MSFQGMLVSMVNAVCDEVGAPLLVIVFYWFRFHSLKGTRSYTTRALYYLGVALFIMPFVITYYALTGALSPIAAVWVVILIWLVPVVPEAWRSVCYELVQIPSHAYALRSILTTAPFELQKDDIPEIQRKLARIGYLVDDFHAVQATAIQSRFLKIAAIFHHLDQWSQKKESFMERNAEYYSDLLRVFDALSFKSIRVLKSTGAVYGAIMEETELQPNDWHGLDSLATRDSASSKVRSAARAAAGSVLEDLRKDMDFLLSNLSLFCARAALASEWSFAGRQRRLQAIGFKVTFQEPVVMRKVAVGVAITLAWSVAWLALFIGAFPIPGDKAAGVTRLLVLTPMEIVISFWIAYYLRRNYAFANEGAFTKTPISFWPISGACTACVVLPFQVYFDYLQFGKDAFLHTVVGNLPLLLIPWTFGTATAVLMQDSFWKSFTGPRMVRLADGGVYGLSLVTAVLLIWAFHRVYPIPLMKPIDSVSLPLVLVAVLISSFAFGATLGYFIIAPIRERSSLNFVSRDLMSRAMMHA